MTQAQAQTIASNLIGQGYMPTVALANGGYIVVVNSPGTAAQTIATFATNNGVQAKVDGAVIFS